MLFRNREEAGPRLAELLGQHHLENPLELALPRGGVVVASEIALREEEILESVLIPTEAGALEGLLGIPADPWGVVIFAHGMGSTRRSPRDQHVARILRQTGLATLLIDLLTEDEEAQDRLTARLRFDIELLADRLSVASRWASSEPRLRRLPIGYFGSSTGAAAALLAATWFPEHLQAIVSRGGRPDLAGPSSLVRVTVPTLLVVGARDPGVLDLNREAMTHLACEHELAAVPGATHLFHEPGTLDAVGQLAAEWFAKHLESIGVSYWPEGRAA